MQFENSENFEEEFTEEHKQRIVEFINAFDPDDDRDPFYVAEIIFGVQESDARHWMAKHRYLEREAKAVKEEAKQTPAQKDLKRIVHSLESIRKSVIKLDLYNKRLIEEVRKKLKKKDDKSSAE